MPSGHTYLALTEGDPTVRAAYEQVHPDALPVEEQDGKAAMVTQLDEFGGVSYAWSAFELAGAMGSGPDASE